MFSRQGIRANLCPMCLPGHPQAAMSSVWTISSSLVPCVWPVFNDGFGGISSSGELASW